MTGQTTLSRDQLIANLRELNLWRDEMSVAMDLAESVHGDQRRAGGGPYLDEHIYPVTLTVARYLAGHDKGEAVGAVMVALLHDSIEDSTTVTERTVARQFGRTIAERVSTLTKPEKRPGSSAGTTEEEESRYVAGVAGAEYEVRVVKVFDRLNNLAAVHQREPDKRRKYLQETREHYLDLAASVDASLRRQMSELLAEQERLFDADLSGS